MSSSLPRQKRLLAFLVFAMIADSYCCDCAASKYKYFITLLDFTTVPSNLNNCTLQYWSFSMEDICWNGCTKLGTVKIGINVVNGLGKRGGYGINLACPGLTSFLDTCQRQISIFRTMPEESLNFQARAPYSFIGKIFLTKRKKRSIEPYETSQTQDKDVVERNTKYPPKVERPQFHRKLPYYKFKYAILIYFCLGYVFLINQYFFLRWKFFKIREISSGPVFFVEKWVSKTA